MKQSSWSWAFLEKLPTMQPLKNFPKFYGIRKFIPMFTRALHWPLFWARSIHLLTPHPFSLRWILILSTHLGFCLPTGLFPSDISIQYLISIPLLPHSCYMLCPHHPSGLDHSNYIWRRVQVMKLLIMQFFATPYHLTPLRFKYSIQHMFSNTLSVCFSLNVRYQVSHPYRTTGKIIILCILIFTSQFYRSFSKLVQ
jgi:hypothetical protein